MHELLDRATAENPVVGNAGGSYLTMRSKSGLIFGVINLIGGLLDSEANCKVTSERFSMSV
jgi:hypothetical protein